MSFRLVLIHLVICALACPGADRLERAASGKVKVVDLSYPLNERTPYWPGPKYFPFKFEAIATLKEDGVFSGKMALPEHIGTHLDAPNHFVAGKISVDQIPLAQLFGPAVVIDVVAEVERDADYQLSVEDIKRWEMSHGRMPRGAIVFAYTGWGRRWNDLQRYKNADDRGILHFPGYSRGAAELLLKKDVKGIGIDTLSVDYGPSRDFIVHRIMHGAGKYHIENVANLDKLPPRGAFVIVAPMKIEGGSGGPARVFALIE